MTVDPSEGWDAVAAHFIAARTKIGATLVRDWARETLPEGAAVLDLGCGSGVPIAQALIEDGFAVFGVDASPSLLAAFRTRFPDAPALCAAAQEGGWFGRGFDAVLAIGLLFLLAEADQARVIARAAAALVPGDRLLFTAPRERCTWRDSLTRRESRSLGEGAYDRCLGDAGLTLVATQVDEGGNHYFDAIRPA